MIHLEQVFWLRQFWIGASYQHDHKTSFVPLYLAYRHRFLTPNSEQQEIRLVSLVAVVNQISSCTLLPSGLAVSPSLSCWFPSFPFLLRDHILSYHPHKHPHAYGHALGDIHFKGIVSRFVSWWIEQVLTACAAHRHLKWVDLAGYTSDLAVQVRKNITRLAFFLSYWHQAAYSSVAIFIVALSEQKSVMTSAKTQFPVDLIVWVENSLYASTEVWMKLTCMTPFLRSLIEYTSFVSQHREQYIKRQGNPIVRESTANFFVVSSPFPLIATNEMPAAVGVLPLFNDLSLVGHGNAR